MFLGAFSFCTQEDFVDENDEKCFVNLKTVKVRNTCSERGSIE